MNPKKEELKEKIKELNQMQEQSHEDVEADIITPLDEKIIEKYEEIWQEILKICKEEKIKDAEIFDEKYHILKWGLEDFIDSYIDFVSYCAYMNGIYREKEIELLKEIMEQFDMDKEKKQEYELMIIENTYLIGNEKEAKKEIDKWIKNNPKQGKGYEIKW